MSRELQAIQAQELRDIKKAVPLLVIQGVCAICHHHARFHKNVAKIGFTIICVKCHSEDTKDTVKALMHSCFTGT